MSIRLFIHIILPSLLQILHIVLQIVGTHCVNTCLHMC